MVLANLGLDVRKGRGSREAPVGPSRATASPKTTNAAALQHPIRAMRKLASKGVARQSSGVRHDADFGSRGGAVTRQRPPTTSIRTESGLMESRVSITDFTRTFQLI